MYCFTVSCLYRQKVDFKSFTMSTGWLRSDQWKPRYPIPILSQWQPWWLHLGISGLQLVGIWANHCFCQFGQKLESKSFTMSPHWLISDKWEPRLHPNGLNGLFYCILSVWPESRLQELYNKPWLAYMRPIGAQISHSLMAALVTLDWTLMVLMDCLIVCCQFGQRLEFESFTMSPGWLRSDQWKPRYPKVESPLLPLAYIVISGLTLVWFEPIKAHFKALGY
jgi:hypothetical protein